MKEKKKKSNKKRYIDIFCPDCNQMKDSSWWRGESVKIAKQYCKKCNGMGFITVIKEEDND